MGSRDGGPGETALRQSLTGIMGNIWALCGVMPIGVTENMHIAHAMMPNDVNLKKDKRHRELTS